MCSGRDAPWLQDLESTSWWNQWQAEYRDVIMLDGRGDPVEVFNLTEHSLLDEGNYASLRALLIDHASAGSGAAGFRVFSSP